MKALLVIDVQYDFLPGGSLAVPDGDAVIPVVNALHERHALAVFTQDWHPAGHESFAVNHPGRKVGEVIDLHGVPQVLWPAHCVQGTRGAELHPALARKPADPVVRKGTDPAIDSYSAFFDNARRKETGLRGLLRGRGVTALTVCGLATDYCVKFSVLDALTEGFAVEVVTAGCRGVNLKPEDAAHAIEAMRAAGARIL